MTYREEQINAILTLLNNMEVKGIENAKRIVMIQQILQQGEPSNDNCKES